MGNKKIPIEEFVSEKKLDKILHIIEKSDDVELNYDRIENILDDFKVKDLGTNRIVFLHKKDKYKNYIFKVAGDSHGIEANYREFYNGDLDKRLTYSYSISNNGVFIVQERVDRMSRDDMKERKKDVRKMLEKLSDKILLVDCKLDNFKNFGIRKNGEVCLLDHGDTIPLPKFQGNEIVNIEEESEVSLRCKKFKEISAEESKQKPCNGKLKYSKNFDYFICEKCGGISPIHEAYRSFYGDRKNFKNIKVGLHLQDDFNPDTWKESIKKYCINTMNNNNEKENNEMKVKMINGEKCTQVKGFWLPEPEDLYIGFYNQVKMGVTKPSEYLEMLGKDIEEYKVRREDQKGNLGENEMKNYASLEEIANIAVNVAIKSETFETVISFDELTKLIIEKGYDEPKFTNIGFVNAVRKAIASVEETCGCVFNETGFSIRIKGRGFVNNNEANQKERINIVKNDNHIVQKEISSSINNKKDLNIPESSIDDSENYSKDDGYNRYKNLLNEKDKEEYINEDINGKITLSHSDIENGMTIYNNQKCVLVGKYFIPLDVLYKYETDDGSIILPKKPKVILKMNNISPKKFKVESDISSNEINESIEISGQIEDYDQMASDKNVDEIISKTDEKTFDSSFHFYDEDKDMDSILSSIIELAEKVASSNWRNKKIVDIYGEINISAIDIMMEAFYSKNILAPNFYDVETSEDGLVTINITEEQFNNFASYCSEIKNVSEDTYKFSFASTDFKNMRIGISSEYFSETYSIHTNPEIRFYYFKDRAQLDSSNILIRFADEYDHEADYHGVTVSVNDVIHAYNLLIDIFDSVDISYDAFSIPECDTYKEYIDYINDNYGDLIDTVINYINDLSKYFETAPSDDELEETIDQFNTFLDEIGNHILEMDDSDDNYEECDNDDFIDDEVETDSPNNISNNNTMKEDESMEEILAKLNEMDARILKLIDTVNENKSSTNDYLKYTVRNINNTDIVSFNVDDLNNKLIIVTDGKSNIAFNLHELVTEEFSKVEQGETIDINVTGFISTSI